MEAQKRGSFALFEISKLLLSKTDGLISSIARQGSLWHTSMCHWQILPLKRKQSHEIYKWIILILLDEQQIFNACFSTPMCKHQGVLCISSSSRSNIEIPCFENAFVDLWRQFHEAVYTSSFHLLRSAIEGVRILQYCSVLNTMVVLLGGVDITLYAGIHSWHNVSAKSRKQARARMLKVSRKSARYFVSNYARLLSRAVFHQLIMPGRNFRMPLDNLSIGWMWAKGMNSHQRQCSTTSTPKGTYNGYCGTRKLPVKINYWGGGRYAASGLSHQIELAIMLVDRFNKCVYMGMPADFIRLLVTLHQI